ncbi:MAG: cell division ATP-binding protein FtsE [Mangrovibacterium sp.]
MSSESIISIKNVDIFRQDYLALQHVNFEVKAGEFVYIIGRVGCGKSSLLKLINAELEIRGGQVEVASYNLVSMKEKQVPFLRRHIGVIYQDFRLLTDRTVYENLEFVLRATNWSNKQKIDERINEVLTQVDMNDKKQRMPYELSGGEQQRVVIARAILNMPDIILADEPTGNLDPMTSRELMRIFMALNEQGITVIMATHDYQLIEQHSARIIHIENKKLFDPQMPTM